MGKRQSKCVVRGEFVTELYALKKDDRGQSLVELAVIMPVFILILLGLIQLSTIRYAEILLHMAARHGARVESLDGNGTAAIKEYLSRHNVIKTDNLRVSIRRRFIEPVDLVDIRIEYRVEPMRIFRKAFPEGFVIQTSYVF